MKLIQTKTMIKTVCAVLALCAFVSACKKKEAAPPGGRGPGSPDAQIFAVTTIRADAGVINDYLALAGDIIAGSTVDAYSDAAGKVTRVHVSPGTQVARGQMIAVVDPSKPGMNYVQHVVHAPISGTVTAVPAEVGMTISQSTPLVRISGGGALEIQLFVPERYISRVRQGLRCEILLDAYPDEVFRGTVREVSPTVDPASRTMSIKLNVDNPGSRLKAGMFAKVNIITEGKTNAVRVPVSSVVSRQGKMVVFVVEPGKEPAAVRQVEVGTGIQSDGLIEITSGVSAGDEVVDKGMTLLSDGTEVNIISRDTEAAASE